MKHLVYVLLAAAIIPMAAAEETIPEPTFDLEPEPMLRVTLNDESFIRGPRVLLGEVATIEGTGAADLAELEITTAPRPGSTNRIQATLIETRIRNSEIAPEKYEISGPALIRATRLHQDILGVELGEDLRNYVLAHLPWDPTNAVVEITPPSFDVTVPDGDVAVEWESNPNYNYLGATSFRGHIYVDGVRERSVMGRVSIEAYSDVVVADRDIPRGTIIRPDDLMLEKKAMSEAVRGSFSDMESVVGKVAKTTIFPGTVLTNRKIDTPILIRRHQTVNVVSKIGSLVVRTLAKSRDDGRVGDFITLTDPNTRETFQGFVQSNGTVEVQ